MEYAVEPEVMDRNWGRFFRLQSMHPLQSDGLEKRLVRAMGVIVSGAIANYWNIAASTISTPLEEYLEVDESKLDKLFAQIVSDEQYIQVTLRDLLAVRVMSLYCTDIEYRRRMLGNERKFTNYGTLIENALICGQFILLRKNISDYHTHVCSGKISDSDFAALKYIISQMDNPRIGYLFYNNLRKQVETNRLSVSPETSVELGKQLAKSDSRMFIRHMMTEYNPN